MAADPSHLKEELLARAEVFRGAFLKVVRDIVRLPDGKTAPREMVLHPGAVVVIALLDDGRVVLERQWRHPVGRVMIEFPAGKLDAGEDRLACARRELLEETGYSAREWAHAGVMHPCIGYSDEFLDIWFARGLQAGRAPAGRGRVPGCVPGRSGRAHGRVPRRPAHRRQDDHRPAVVATGDEWVMDSGVAG